MTHSTYDIPIAGLQKLTLLDFPGRTACTIFLNGCNLRCPYCHNFSLAEGKGEIIDIHEVFQFLDKRKGLLDGVAITGGEPCIHKKLPEFLSYIKEKGFLVKLDTNGMYPDILSEILNKNLADYIAMDIKNSPEKYALTTGISKIKIKKIKKSISMIMDSGLDYEFRTTVVKEYHDEDDFYKIGELIRGAKQHYLQQFIDRESVCFKDLHSPSEASMKRYLNILKPYVEHTNIRGI